MNNVDRAKQFLPFDALKGFKEALELKEIEIEREQRKKLSEASLNELDNKLNRIKIGSCVKIKFFVHGIYKEVDGKVNGIDYIKKRINLDNNLINLCDIVEIHV